MKPIEMAVLSLLLLREELNKLLAQMHGEIEFEKNHFSDLNNGGSYFKLGFPTNFVVRTKRKNGEEHKRIYYEKKLAAQLPTGFALSPCIKRHFLREEQRLVLRKRLVNKCPDPFEPTRK